MADVGADPALDREVKRCFRLLSADGATAIARADGSALIRVPGRRGARDAAIIAPGVLRQFLARGWLKRDAPGSAVLRLSDTGLGHYRRLTADDTPFAAQHGARRIVSHAAEGPVLLNEAESPLAWLARRGHLTAEQAEAGERLRRVFTRAGLSPRTTVDLTRPVRGRAAGNGQAEAHDAALDARAELNRLAAVLGPGLADLALDVCCFLVPLSEAERRRGWPARSAKVILALALDRLAAHFGLVATGRSHMRSRAWAAADEERESEPA